MSIKYKTFGVLMAATVSVTSFGAVITAKADMYQQTCFKCGEESLFSEWVGIREEKVGGGRPCKHEHESEMDIQVNRYEKRRFYCADCDIYWEDYFYLGTFWHCTYDGEYYDE